MSYVKRMIFSKVGLDLDVSEGIFDIQNFVPSTESCDPVFLDLAHRFKRSTYDSNKKLNVADLEKREDWLALQMLPDSSTGYTVLEGEYASALAGLRVEIYKKLGFILEF